MLTKEFKDIELSLKNIRQSHNKDKLSCLDTIATLETELKKLDKNTYQIIDIRDEIEISHGAVKGAVACKPEEILNNPDVDKAKKLVTAAAAESTARKWLRI